MSYKTHYFETTKPKLYKELKLVNIFSVPEMKKVIVNVGVGEAVSNKKAIEHVVSDLTAITGQKPIVTKARKAVAAFKIRKGLPIGVKVTLRRERMYEFVEKLFKIVFPRIRDFRGISPRSLDGSGNLNIGFPDQTLWPEIEYDKIDKIRGLEITIVTNTKDDTSAQRLFEELGLPFEQNEKLKMKDEK